MDTQLIYGASWPDVFQHRYNSGNASLFTFPTSYCSICSNSTHDTSGVTIVDQIKRWTLSHVVVYHAWFETTHKYKTSERRVGWMVDEYLVVQSVTLDPYPLYKCRHLSLFCKKIKNNQMRIVWHSSVRPHTLKTNPAKKSRVYITNSRKGS